MVYIEELRGTRRLASRGYREGGIRKGREIIRLFLEIEV